ncbi:hypothetical protein BWQ96_07789 [Gracilariopsis chorda]|uniref:Uncharacterized protein n=1 Tax=Gracilariopsis chorda TaxID=448386 RepID=A0A2V3IMY9_9FLOR|nr:hypothetical protein BWQ96_07789 [Gracilariopsis chorda]|eukprot:PXF42480.1 hypothetical protein BWQ96_07789 [Gracilariopsis chorda]
MCEREGGESHVAVSDSEIGSANGAGGMIDGGVEWGVSAVVLQMDWLGVECDEKEDEYGDGILCVKW